jgi:hypothetical protein
MPDRATSYEDLTPGYKFPYTTFELSASLVSKYLKAVDSESDGFVPPLAITACAIAATTKSVPLPPDTIAIHASQELEFFKMVPIGSAIECHIRVLQKISRGKMSMLILGLEVFGKDKEKVQSGKATIALPT